MRYYSLNNRGHFSNFENAVVRGLAPDKGLYFPEKIIKLKNDFFKDIHKLDKTEIAFEVIKGYVGDEISGSSLKGIIRRNTGFRISYSSRYR